MSPTHMPLRPENPERFIVVGMQRSGTTVTQICLRGHPNVAAANGEVHAAPFFTRGLSVFMGGKESYVERKRRYPALFDLMTSFDANESTMALGFKTAVGTHREAIAFVNCLREYLPDVKVIIVHRDDLAAQYGSRVLARKSGEYHAWEGRASTHAGEIEIDPEDFERYVRQCRGTLAQLRTLARTHEVMEFNYEADIATGKGYPKLHAFVGLPSVPITWLKMTKIAPPPEEFIANYQAMRQLADSIPVPTESEALATAAAELREQDKEEVAAFLMHRAADRLERRRVDEALADISLALEKEQPNYFDNSLRGRVFGALEALAGELDAGVAEPVLGKLAEGSADNPYFLTSRARLRVRNGNAADAHADLTALLSADGELDTPAAREALDLLVPVLETLGDVDLADQTVTHLRTRHGEDPHFVFLEGVVASHHGRRDDAVRCLRRTLAELPNHAKAAALLEQWSSD